MSTLQCSAFQCIALQCSLMKCSGNAMVLLILSTHFEGLRGGVWMSYRKSTFRSWCQMNRNGHSSPVKHKVEGKPHKILEKLKKTSGNSTLFGHFSLKYFYVTCVPICISLNSNDITPVLHTCLTSYWSYLCSSDRYLVVLLWFWVMQVKKKKTRTYS